ncbi:RNA polymerase II-associated protein 1-like [Pogonomyrmex barbatus]|uniref:RNA polymerase II-associated protein 1-like n=1 Tax=Pogonomyrmex barbatus TaxID=144034 RepID=A0A6I9WNT3_9HYME|nr:RNA polymerase II-associated protein 1-like [Pogonomyrmex barbatus]
MTDKVMKRPEADEDEEELLRQQEEFLKARQSPSVKIINLRGSTDVPCKVSSTSKTRSQFSKKQSRKRDAISISQGCGEVINPAIKDKIQETIQGKLEDMVQNLPTAPSNIILGNIMERKFDIKKYEFNCAPIAAELKCPKLFESDDMEHLEKKTNKQSLFWQKISKLKSAKDDLVKIQKDEPSYSKEKEANITEDCLAIEIHKENLEKLAQMSEVEILEEKKKLEEILDPKIIQFLKNKNKFGKRPIEQDKKQCNISMNNEKVIDTGAFSDKRIKLLSSDDSEMDCENVIASILATKKKTTDTCLRSHDKKVKFADNVDTKMDCEDNVLNIPQLSKEIFEESKQKGWLHMNTPEPEKLEWMEDLPENKEDESVPNKEYNARFDFKGLLLPYKDESLTVDKGLYHHGEEPERPGYSLQELLQLSRSSTQQQRCTALITLANIMEKTRSGCYDKVLQPAPLIALSQKNILLLLRFSLDDSSVAVVTATLQALRAFLVSEADELCLDRLHGYDKYTEPTLTPQLDEKDTNGLKDHELAQLDAVATLLRSDILLRIKYILSEMHPPPVGVTCALEILIRLARHSHITALNISSSPYLLDTIIKNFIPLSTDYLSYLKGTTDLVNTAYGIPVVQAIKLCRVLVTYGKKPVAQKLSNFKIIQTILTYIESETGNDDINFNIESLRLWQMLLHYEVELDSVTAAILTIKSQFQRLLDNHNIQNMPSELACEHAAAWIAIASHEKMLKQDISTLLLKWSTQFSSISNAKWGVMKLITKCLSAVNDMSTFKTMWLANQQIFSTLRFNSNLLSDCNSAIDREPSCLPNLNVLMENGKVQPIVSVDSCIPFLATVLNTFYNNFCVSEIRTIFEHSFFRKYLHDLETTEWNLERSWYSRTELYLLTAVVKAASLLGDTINNQTAQIVWRITIKLISTLPADATDHVRNLLQIALSSEKVNLEIITNELTKINLASTVDQIQIGLQFACLLYERYITPNGDWDQAAMPKDWLFLPLVHIYTKCKNDVKLQPEDKNSILTVLSLALILPDLMDRLSPTLRFSRLILVYLCDTAYLNNDVSVLLLNIFSNLLKTYYGRLNFRIELPGLSSFTDLFTALCEHFCSSSYGDDGFAMMLLVPMTQRHDPHYRKLLWSEHAGTLRLEASDREVCVSDEKISLSVGGGGYIAHGKVHHEASPRNNQANLVFCSLCDCGTSFGDISKVFE